MAEGIIKDSDVTGADIYGLARKSLEKYITAIDSSNKDLSKQAELLDKITKSADAASKKGIDQLVVSRKKLEQVADKANKNDQERMKILKTEERLRKKLADTVNGERDEVIKLQEENRRATKAARENIKTTLDQKNAYETLKRQTNKAQLEFKRLAAQHGVNSKQARAAKLRFDALDKSLRRINKEARDGRRDVGRYAIAWRDAQSALGAVGVTIGIGFALREGIQILDEYDEKIADIMKTTNLIKEDAKELSGDLFNIDTKTSITNLQELIVAGGRLNVKGKKDLLEFAESADKAFVALGDDLEGTADEIATSMGKISNQFGLEDEFGVGKGIEKVGSGINELSANSKAAAPSILDFTNRMVGLSSVLKIEDVQALGALFDEAGQSVEISATTLQKLIPALASDFEKFSKVAGKTPEEFKQIAENSPIEALKLVALGAKNSEKGLFNLTSTLESYGVESARATGIVGTLTNNVDRLTELQQISNKAIDEGTSLTEEFDVKNDTLGATIGKATKKIKEQVIAFDEATGFTDKLKNSIAFLADNFSVILSVGGKLLKFLAIYKARIIVLKALNGKFGASLKNISAAFKKGETNGKSFTGALKSIGSALKGLGFTAAIAGAIELAKAFYDVASGARQARFDAEQLEIQMGKVNAEVDKDIDRRKTQLDRALELAKTDEERLKLQKEFNAINKMRSDEIKTELERERGRLKMIKDFKAEADSPTGFTGFDSYIKTLTESADQFSDLFGEFDDIDDIFGKQEAKVKALEAGYNKYNQTISESSHQLEVVQANITANIENLNKDKKAIEDNTGAIEDQTEAYKNLKTEFDRQVESASDIAKRRTKQFEQETEELQENLTEQLIIITDFEREKVLTSDEANANTLALELKALEKRKELLIKYGQEKGDIDLQISQKSLELAKATSSDVIDVEKDENAQRLEARKELFDALEDLGEKEIDNFIKRSKRKQDALDEEINQIQSLEDAFRDSAKNQNALASESLAELESTKNEKIRQKKDEANKQAALEELKAAYSALNSFLDKGDDFASATAKSISGIKVFKDLVSSIASIPGFFKGTKNAPEGLAWTDEQGAEIHLDKDGNVKDWGSDGGARLKKLEQGDQILTASESKTRQTEILNRQLSGAAMLQNVSMNKTSSTDQSLLLEMRKLRQTINDKPEYSLHPILKNGLLVGLNEQQRRGSKIENFKTLTRS